MIMYLLMDDRAFYDFDSAIVLYSTPDLFDAIDSAEDFGSCMCFRTIPVTVNGQKYSRVDPDYPIGLYAHGTYVGQWVERDQR